MQDKILRVYNLINNLITGDLLALNKLKERLSEIEDASKLQVLVDSIISDGFKKNSKEELLECFFISYPNVDREKEFSEESSLVDGDVTLDFSTEIFQIFIVEAKDRLKEALDLILKIEDKTYTDKDINSLFRIFHTIKGESGFLNLVKLGDLTHQIEFILDNLRHNELEITTEAIDNILKGCDLVYEIIKTIENCRPDLYELIDVYPIIRELKEISSTESKTLKSRKINNEDKKLIQKESMIKVKASLIDKLVDLVGELIISENQLHDYEQDSQADENQSEDLELVKGITKDIQSIVMMLRTVKIARLLPNIKRVIRDISQALKKRVSLEVIGEDLEIDRNLIEDLEEPLLHIIRNAIGHGIESDTDRELRGKSSVGNILFKSERSGNQIIITIRDDGAGLNTDKIIDKALKMELITEEDLEEMDEDDISQLIFNPGFSTSEDINKVSGRGVGMDIVKSRVNALRGNISVTSKSGEYTQFVLTFPLIMAIVESLIIEVDNVSFVIPIINIEETFKLERSKVHYINGKPVIRLRGDFVPVIRLRNYFDFDTEAQDIELVIIVTHNRKSYALIVDEIVAQKEVVIKTLGNKFNELKGISAGTILPGGKVGYIINVEQLVSIDVVGKYEV